MKTIFIDLADRLQTVSSLRWVDEQKGQMNFEKPPVVFPAALLQLTLPNCQNLNRLQQSCQLQVAVTLAFDFMGQSYNAAPAEAREASLAYYDVVEQTKAALQGFGTAEMNPLEMINFSHVPRPDGYKVVVMTFRSSFREG